MCLVRGLPCFLQDQLLVLFYVIRRGGVVILRLGVGFDYRVFAAILNLQMAVPGLRIGLPGVPEVNDPDLDAERNVPRAIL